MDMKIVIQIYEKVCGLTFFAMCKVTIPKNVTESFIIYGTMWYGKGPSYKPNPKLCRE
jgi:hypothetical protein